MPYSEKFIRAATKANFQSLVDSGEITNDSIGFIEDTNEIWARGKYYATPEVFISDGVEPTGDSDIWIDTSENSEFISIEDAPSNGNIYGRQDGQWVKIEDGGDIGEITETLKVILTSNQSNPNSDLNGATVTVTYGENGNSQQTWQGSELTFQIPMGVEYTVSVSAIEGYSTPNSETHTAIIGNTRNVTFTYQSEFLTVNVTGIPSGFTITISGVGSQTSTSQVHKVPYGTQYTVSASKVNGYTAPSNQQFTAGQDNRTVTMAYTEIVNGVFVYDNTGGLTPISSWDTGNNSSAVGIALITDNTRLVIKKGLSASSSGLKWSVDLYETDISGLTNYNSQSNAITDYNGQSNTNIIHNAAPSESTDDNAANYCLQQTITVNGRTVNGYLPSEGELVDMWNNKSTIENALTTIGSQTIRSLNTSDDYTPNLWSSTEFSSYRAWFLFWGHSPLFPNETNKNYLNSGMYALPVFPLD